MRVSTTSIVLGAVFFVSVAPLHAQLCFRGRPAPDCSAFLLTEAGYSYGTSGSRGYWELGGMVNLSERNAIGGTFYLSAGEGSEYFGPKPRFRHWLSAVTSVDLSAGILFSHDEVGVTGHAGFNFGDYIALTTHLDIVEPIAWYGGVRLGSYPGVIVGVGVPLVALAFLLSSGGWD